MLELNTYKDHESLVMNLLSCTRNFPMSCLGEPLILGNEKRLLHHPQPVVLSHTMKAHFTLDAFNTVTDDCNLLRLPLLIRVNILDEFDQFTIYFQNKLM